MISNTSPNEKTNQNKSFVSNPGIVKWGQLPLSMYTEPNFTDKILDFEPN